MIIMASASGTPVPAIARLVAADEDTVRDVIHPFNEMGLAALDPQWAGGRPRLISDDDRSSSSRRPPPARDAGPAVHLLEPAQTRRLPGRQLPRPVRIGRERLRQILHAAADHLPADPDLEGIRKTRTRTPSSTGSSTSPPDSRTGVSRSTSSGRCRSGPPTAPAGHRQKQPRPAAGDLSPHPRHPVLPRLLLPRRRPALGRQPPPQGRRPHPGRAEIDPGGAARRRPDLRHHGQPVREQDPDDPRLGGTHKVELCFTPTSASWANPIEAQFGPLRSSPWPAPTTRTTPSWPAACRTTCAGATPTPATPTSSPPNAANAPASAANASNAGAAHDQGRLTQTRRTFVVSALAD